MTDVVIVGAGPGGLALGCYLANAGIDHLILERGHHPRAHVGESLLPSALGVFEEIGFLEVLEEAGFPRSPGVVYHTLDQQLPIAVEYAEFGGVRPYSFHADRARLDMLLMKHAEGLGSRIVQGAAVRRVEVDGSGAVCGITADIGTHSVQFPARVVVDATGRQTLLGRQLGLRTRDARLDQIAFHAWFDGVDRGAPQVAHSANIYFLPIHRGWAWHAPIDDRLTSVGLVTDRTAFRNGGMSIQDYFQACVDETPALDRALRRAHPVRPLSAVTSVNYALDRVCGDGWMAIGDAARFLDPVFSSGVGVAVESARLAARQIEVALSQTQNSVTQAMLQPYEDRVLSSAAIWRDFIDLYYRLMPAFTVFVRSAEHRPAILRLLQGTVDDPADIGVLEHMKQLVTAVEAQADHPLRSGLRSLS